MSQLLLQSDARLVSLVGHPGVGKSRFAQQLALTLERHFEAGVVTLALPPVPNVALISHAVSRALQLAGGPRRALPQSLAEQFGERELLLILDGLDHADDAGQLLTELLGSSSRLKLLVTSRAGFGGRSEYRLQPLAVPGPDLDSPEQLDDYAACRLFIVRAGLARANATVSRNEAAAIAGLCRLLGGLPLALELVAAQTRVHSLPVLLQLLTDRIGPPADGERSSAELTRILLETLFWSYEALSCEQQLLFRRLAFFSDGWSVRAATSVAPDSEQATTDPAGVVRKLAESGLVQRLPDQSDQPRYAMPTAVRDFGLRQLDAHDETDAIRWRHAQYFANLTEAAEIGLRGPHQVEWLERLYRDENNLVVALFWSQLGPRVSSMAFRLTAALGWFWWIRGHHDEARFWLEAVLRRPAEQATAANATLSAARVKALACAALLASERGDLQIAEQYLDQSLDLALRTGDHQRIGLSLAAAAALSVRSDRQRGAALLFETALQLFRKSGDSWSVSQALVQLGHLAASQGQADRAQLHYEQALPLVRETGDRWEEAFLRTDLARLLHQTGQTERAGSELLAALRLHRELDQQDGVADCLAIAIELAVLGGRWRAAATLFGTLIAGPGGPEISWPFTRIAGLPDDLATARAAIGPLAFSEAAADGRVLSQTQADALAAAIVGLAPTDLSRE